MTTTEMEIQNLTAFPYNQNLLENETALCLYYVGGCAVYKTETGGYYCHYLEAEDTEFFSYGQVEAVKELEPLPEDYLKLMPAFEELETRLGKMGFRPVQIVYEDEAHTEITLYSEDLQVYCNVSGEDSSHIFLQTHKQLAALNPRVNNLAAPLTLELDEDGDVVQGVQK